MAENNPVDLREYSLWFKKQKQDVDFVNDDIQRKTFALTEIEYQWLLANHSKSSGEFNPSHLEDIHEKISTAADSTTEFAEALEKRAHEIEASLDKAGPVAIFFTNALFIILGPLRWFHEKRPPTRDEAIKLALCIAALILTSLITAGVGGAIALSIFTIVCAGIASAKFIQTVRIKSAELRDCIQVAAYGKSEIDRLNEEVNNLLKKETLTDEERTLIMNHRKSLDEHVNQYIQDGYKIRKLRNELNHPRKSMTNLIHKATGFLFFIGAILLIPPCTPFGAGVMLAASSVSIATTLLTTLAASVENWREGRQISPAVAMGIRHGTHSPKTAKEIRYAKIWKHYENNKNIIENSKPSTPLQVNEIKTQTKMQAPEIANTPHSEKIEPFHRPNDSSVEHSVPLSPEDSSVEIETLLKQNPPRYNDEPVAPSSVAKKIFKSTPTKSLAKEMQVSRPQNPDNVIDDKEDDEEIKPHE